jgi:hypothetical protein
VRAYNGSYWGDWQSLSVAVSAAAAVTAAPPVLLTQTATQTWTAGSSVSLTLPAGTFTDPQNEALSYTATLANGQALPSWLSFNAATGTFSGIAPASATTLNITVTATDTSQLSASETFAISVVAPPKVTAATVNQTWTEGQAFSLTLASNTFSDPQGESLTYKATLANGRALPSWLTFNAATQTFSGMAPNSVQSVAVTVTATDSSGLSAAETFTASVQAPQTPKWGITVTSPTANQSWTDGETVSLTLPGNTFTDWLGQRMQFLAYEVSGPNVTSWLHFNPTTDTLFGTVPGNATGTVRLEVIAYDRYSFTACDLFSVSLGASSGGTQTSHVAVGSVGLSTQQTVSSLLGSIGVVHSG